jgi:hypothetical protein
MPVCCGVEISMPRMQPIAPPLYHSRAVVPRIYDRSAACPDGGRVRSLTIIIARRASTVEKEEEDRDMHNAHHHSLFSCFHDPISTTPSTNLYYS